jgi:hypothetical protein
MILNLVQPWVRGTAVHSDRPVGDIMGCSMGSLINIPVFLEAACGLTAGLLTQGASGVPQDPLAPRRGPFGSTARPTAAH